MGGLTAPLVGRGEVTVVGRTNPQNVREFLWTVTNDSDKPITSFEAPHYYGKLFTPPEGWVIDEMTGNVGHGDKPVPGIIRTRTESNIQSIRRGRSADFRLRVDQRGGHYAPGKVIVGFSDGSTATIPGVLCPTKPPFLQNYFPAIGLAGIFITFIAIRMIIRKRPVEFDNAPS